jgi:hypothetical protein
MRRFAAVTDGKRLLGKTPRALGVDGADIPGESR